MARDRIRVQRWRRQNRLEQHEVSEEKEETTTQVLGHGPGQGCDFCDNLRLEGADGLKEEDEEDGEEEEWERAPRDDLGSIAETAETLFDDEEGEEGVSMDDSQTLRAIQEERIIDRYLKSPSSSSFSSSPPPPHNHNHNRNQGGYSSSRRRRHGEGEGGEEREKKASQWARSYTRLLDGE